MDFGDLEFRIDEIKANYETQKASYLRRQMLFNEGAISAEEYEEYKNLYNIIKIRITKMAIVVYNSSNGIHFLTVVQ